MIGCAGTTPNEKLSLSERLELGLDYLDAVSYTHLTLPTKA